MAAQSAIGTGDEAWRLLDEAHARLVAHIERDLAEECGLSMPQFRALAALASAPGGYRMNGLAQTLHMSKSGLTRLVDRLEAQGWVARSPADDDRRAIRATLTTSGEGVFQRALPVYQRSLRETLYSVLSAPEVAALSELLRRLVEGLDAGPAL
ncbi:Transcriptional repressor MprA [bacterium HR29]|jgi:DNA-binding MarR family transcriptional regulator|nr:Transcriptional repressor MprA [bacterium HR29]